MAGDELLLGAADLSGAYALQNSLLTAGETVLPRHLGSLSNIPAQPSGVMTLVFFTAQRTETITQVRVATGATLAAATPTLCRMGIYLMAGTSGTLVASTPNDTTLFAAANTKYAKAFSAQFDKVAGERYAFAKLIVSAAAMPTFNGLAAQNNGTSEWEVAPRLNGAITSLADLPGSFVDGSIATTTRCPQALLLP